MTESTAFVRNHQLCRREKGSVMSHAEDRPRPEGRGGLVGESMGGSAAETTSRRRSPEASSSHVEEPSVVLDLGNGK